MEEQGRRWQMPVTVSLPDEILASDSEDVSRKVLEQVALDGFRSGQITAAQVRRILGFDSRLQVYEFLAAHGIPWVDYEDDELQREVDTLGELTP
jgi:predicted HTH domain antitoxin